MIANWGFKAEADGQKGVALVIVLLFLFIMTLIGVAAMQSGDLQERAAGNLKDQDVSFQTAEDAVRQGEAFVQAQPFGSLSPVTTAPCPIALNACVWSGGVLGDPTVATFWTNNAANLQTGTVLPGFSSGAVAAPTFVVESSGAMPGLDLTIGTGAGSSMVLRTMIFDVTGRAVGRNNGTVTVIRTKYGRLI